MRFRSAEEIAKDNNKGAAELLADVIESIKKIEEDEIEGYLETLVMKRYSMTPLVNLANKIFLSLERGEDIGSKIEDIEDDFLSRIDLVVTETRDFIKNKNYNKILTLSYSSTVVKALSNIGKVKVLESRPKMEGRKTAKKLAKKGNEVEYWVDAGMCKPLENVDCVMVGADTISKKGFLNKIGTRPLAIVSKSLGKKFYVVADSSKILSSKIPPSRGESHPPNEVWDNENSVIVRNDYFELTQLKRAEFINENGRMKSKEIKKIVEKKEVSERVLNIHPLIRER